MPGGRERSESSLAATTARAIPPAPMALLDASSDPARFSTGSIDAELPETMPGGRGPRDTSWRCACRRPGLLERRPELAPVWPGQGS